MEEHQLVRPFRAVSLTFHHHRQDMARPPKKELEQAEKQFEEFDAQVKEMTMDRMNAAPKNEVEPQTKLAQSEIEKCKDIYLKPKRTIGCKEKFNEKFRDKYNFDKEYVHFIAENHEIIGETIDLWSRPYPGMPAEEWSIPTNKPVWAPRYVAEQIKRKSYHRLKMEENRTTGSDGLGTYYGTMAVDTTIPRLDVRPAQLAKKSIFMGATSF